SVEYVQTSLVVQEQGRDEAWATYSHWLIRHTKSAGSLPCLRPAHHIDSKGLRSGIDPRRIPHKMLATPASHKEEPDAWIVNVSKPGLHYQNSHIPPNLVVTPRRLPILLPLRRNSPMLGHQPLQLSDLRMTHAPPHPPDPRQPDHYCRLSKRSGLLSTAWRWQSVCRMRPRLSL